MAVACALITAQVVPAWADSSEEMSAELQEMKKTLKELQATIQTQNHLIQKQQSRIDELERKMASQPAAPAAQPAGIKPPPSGVTGRAAPSGLQAFNPEIGVIADMTAIMSRSQEDAEGNDKISVRELELVFAHDIDPHSRFDSTITLSDFEDVSIEEAYITHWGLPLEVKGRLGRMRPKVGKASAIHRDQLDTVDMPLVVQRYLGVEGLSRTGLELSRFMPTLYEPLTQELIIGIMEGGIGEEGTLFGETRRRPSFYSHLKNFFDISDETSLEFGLTHLVGSSDDDAGFEVNAFGADATLIHYFNPTNKLKWQNEVYLQDREEFFSSESAEDTGEEIRTDMGRHPWGAYSLLDYRLSPRFSAGVRGDYVQLVDADPANIRSADTALSAYLTFHQSEFARWRFQVQHVEEADGGHDDRFMLQGTVAIGVHKHQLQ